jgi:hypothetical protein
MKFEYENDVPTVEAAMHQIVEAAYVLDVRGVDRVDRIAEEGLAEIRRILSKELSTLRDERGIAVEANAVLMQAMALVEGTLS